MRRIATIAAALAALLVPATAGAQTPGPTPQISFGFASAETKLVVSYGQGATAIGRLLDAGGTPIAGAPVAITVHETRSDATDVPGGTVTTGADGRFTVAIPKGPSRTVTVGYRSAPDQPVVTKSVVLSVRAGVLLRATPRALHTGQQLRLSGSLRGGSLPAGGKVVLLQVRRNGRWLTFGDARATRSSEGRFSFRYRFSKVQTVRRLRFRALVQSFAQYPYARGASRSVLVTVRGRGA